MVKGFVQVGVCLLIIFIAMFTLLYIFDSLNQLSIRCKRGEKLEICNLLEGFTFTGLVVLLLIGSFISIICVVGYVLLSTL